MAKENSILKLKGRLGDLVFYQNSEGHQVRTLGGISRERIMNDANFIRTRENMNEFGNINRAGKLIRNSINEFLRQAKDMRAGSRLVSLTAKVKNMDTVSPRGERTFANGFATPAGQEVLVGFDFNKYAPLRQILHRDFELDAVLGSLSIAGFKPRTHLTVPEFATHVNIGLAWVSLEAENHTSQTVYSDDAPVVINDVAQDVTVTLDTLPAAAGVKMFYVLVEFFQEVNGELYELKSDHMNALKIVHIE